MPQAEIRGNYVIMANAGNMPVAWRVLPPPTAENAEISD
jgi:hypothetical protein